MGGEVHRVGLRAGRFVEAGPQWAASGSINILGPWSSIWYAWNNGFMCKKRFRVLHDLWLVSLDVCGLQDFV